jgi:S1-C subfamily serine protease
MELIRSSPADLAGVQPGDVIVAVDGHDVENAGQLRNELARAEVGTQLRLTLLRQGRRIDVRVPVEERRPDA